MTSARATMQAGVRATLARLGDQSIGARLKSGAIGAAVAAARKAPAVFAAGGTAAIVGAALTPAVLLPIAFGAVVSGLNPPAGADEASRTGTDWAVGKQIRFVDDSEAMDGLRAEAARLDGRSAMWPGTKPSWVPAWGQSSILAAKHAVAAGLGGVGASGMESKAREAALLLRRAYNQQPPGDRAAFIAAVHAGLQKTAALNHAALKSDYSPAVPQNPDATLQARGSPDEPPTGAASAAATTVAEAAAATATGASRGVGVQNLGAALAALIDEVDRLRLFLLVASEQVDLLSTEFVGTLVGSQTGRDVLDAFDEARLAVDDAASDLAATIKTSGDYLDVLRT
ncbi:hypothetical protein [Curtobacterium sp. MCPF17_046]|uniref:hypothetical protein n=1 Tax=Curtobacterium sp. MCPF17_046 TaxID=2175663 RepID=UPI0011B3F217|nr:hypothetical protein [Curtobacterium sp. MCPF17_046]